MVEPAPQPTPNLATSPYPFLRPHDPLRLHLQQCPLPPSHEVVGAYWKAKVGVLSGILAREGRGAGGSACSMASRKARSFTHDEDAPSTAHL